MPFHDPHELSTNAAMTSASARLAIRLHLDNLSMLIHLPQRVAPGRQARGRTTANHPDRQVSRLVQDQEAVPAADTTAEAVGCSRYRRLAARPGAAHRTSAAHPGSARRVHPSAPRVAQGAAG